MPHQTVTPTHLGGLPFVSGQNLAVEGVIANVEFSPLISGLTYVKRRPVGWKIRFVGGSPAMDTARDSTGWTVGGNASGTSLSRRYLGFNRAIISQLSQF